MYKRCHTCTICEGIRAPTSDPVFAMGSYPADIVIVDDIAPRQFKNPQAHFIINSAGRDEPSAKSIAYIMADLEYQTKLGRFLGILEDKMFCLTWAQRCHNEKDLNPALVDSCTIYTRHIASGARIVIATHEGLSQLDVPSEFWDRDVFKYKLATYIPIKPIRELGADDVKKCETALKRALA